MTDESSEKQYDPSSKRLEDLRRKGQVMRSRDLSGGLLVLMAVITLSMLGNQYHFQFKQNFTESFGSIANIMHQQDYFLSIVKGLVEKNFILIIPILLVSLLSALLSAFIFGGWNFTLQSVAFNFNKLNPVTNLGNIFSARTLIEVGKAFLKFSLVFIIAWVYFQSHFDDFFGLANLQVKSAIAVGFELVFGFVWSLLISLFFIVAADIAHQYMDYNKRNKMSFQELKDENKETDGNPENKRRQKSVQFALLRQRLTQTVPTADVIITNPTHYAVALRYIDGKDKAPKVIAKGKDYIAHQIRTIAAASGIPIYPAPPLARAVFYSTKIGSAVHPDLYMAVAVVLAYVHQLKRYQQGVGEVPQLSNDLVIPDRFVFND